jgi:hypothetical protein
MEVVQEREIVGGGVGDASPRILEPNAVALSPDAQRLYVADRANKYVCVTGGCPVPSAALPARAAPELRTRCIEIGSYMIPVRSGGVTRVRVASSAYRTVFVVHLKEKRLCRLTLPGCVAGACRGQLSVHAHCYIASLLAVCVCGRRWTRCGCSVRGGCSVAAARSTLRHGAAWLSCAEWPPWSAHLSLY